jgi:hypothetical protein
VSATTEAHEPAHTGNPGGGSVWYRWTAPATATATIDTRTSSFDTMLAVYTGSAVDVLTLIAANDDENFPTTVTSRLQFAATAGTTYRIVVDGFNYGDGAYEGSVTLNWAQNIADTTAPNNPSVSSPSHLVGVASTDRTVDITWSGASDPGGSGVDGFSYEWSTSAITEPDTVKEAEESASSTTSPSLVNGTHWFHLRTRDNAGNWSAATHIGPFVIISETLPPAPPPPPQPPPPQPPPPVTPPPPVSPPPAPVPVKRCTVPNVRGKTLPAARAALLKANCKLGRVSRGYSTRVKKGRVISQSRRPGARFAKGTAVNVVVSRGRRR